MFIGIFLRHTLPLYLSAFFFHFSSVIYLMSWGQKRFCELKSWPNGYDCVCFASKCTDNIHTCGMQCLFHVRSIHSSLLLPGGLCYFIPMHPLTQLIVHTWKWLSGGRQRLRRMYPQMNASFRVTIHVWPSTDYDQNLLCSFTKVLNHQA